MKKPSYLPLLLIVLAINTFAKAELIVLGSPPTDVDSYYAPVADDIANFQVIFAKAIKSHGDDVLILSNQKFYDYYVKHLGADAVLLAPLPDIWLRDFTVLNAAHPVMFRYTAAAQGNNQSDAKAVQNAFAAVAEKAGLAFAQTDLINDGGNFVDDYAGNVVISKKFLRDNKLSEDEARIALAKITQARHIAFIEADEQGGLEHADGVVSFVAENTLMINMYHKDKAYAKQLTDDLSAALPNVKIYEIITPYDGSKIYDNRFGSACGLYTNALVTPKRIYLPQFGIAEDDIAIKQVSAITTREVVPIPSHQVCHMGGGVRCMSLQLRGDNAKKLLRYAKKAQQIK